MSKLNVRVGQEIIRGEIIGHIGNTSVSAALHLHYEGINHGVKVNPAHYFLKKLLLKNAGKSMRKHLRQPSH